MEKDPSFRKFILGIDLGTTNSVASYWNGNTSYFIQNKESYIFPSIIQFTKQGKEISSENRNNAIRNFKRITGKDTSKIETLKLIPELNTNVKINNNKLYFYNPYENKNYTIEELNSLILNKIRIKANKQLKYEISDVVITIPAHFDQIQRESVLISSKLANLNCIRLINEPTAAAISYGLNYHNDINILIFDLGGGTFDLSILNIDDGLFEVINTYGDNRLGGEDFTKILIDDAINKFREKNKYYKLQNNNINKNISLLRNKCEHLKCNIKNNNSFVIKKFYNDNKKNIKIDLIYSITRSEINKLFQPLLNKITQYLDKIILLSNFNKSDFEYIILVGGSTKLQCIKYIVNTYFKKEAICTINPETVVAIGAGILGYTLNNPDTPFSSNIALVDILPLSIGIDSDNGIMTKIIKKGTKIPVTKYKYFTTEEDNQKEVIIKIYQGERKLIKDNRLIGNFTLNNIRLKQKSGVIIKVEIYVDNNGIININAYEKGTDNNKSIIIKANDLLYDNDKINELLKEAEKYQDIDNYKYKLQKKFILLQNQIDNLKYNCYHNSHINLSKNEYNDLNNFIIKLIKKFEITIKPIKFMFYDNLPYKELDKQYLNKITNNIKKLIKINKKKYPGIILNYNNSEKQIKTYKKDDQTSIDSNLSNNNNILFKKQMTNLINNIDNKISEYSKNTIINYINNSLYKLESIRLDSELYNEYMKKTNDLINKILSNDSVIIEKYGNISIIKKIINIYKCDLQITKEYILSSIFSKILIVFPKE